jgi:hypothetical protein
MGLLRDSFYIIKIGFRFWSPFLVLSFYFFRTCFCVLTVPAFCLDCPGFLSSLYNTHITNIHAPRRDSNPQSQQARLQTLLLRPLGHWDRQLLSYPGPQYLRVRALLQTAALGWTRMGHSPIWFIVNQYSSPRLNCQAHSTVTSQAYVLVVFYERKTGWNIGPRVQTGYDLSMNSTSAFYSHVNLLHDT